jgi:dephospho-CoA kinase
MRGCKVKEMKVIGIIGGVGSGKSFVADILEKEFHANLINMDKIAHKLMQKGGISYDFIVEYFGNEILKEDGEIDRAKMAKIVYQNPEQLQKLNSFTHPYVLQYTKNYLEEKRENKEELVCIETALPVEARISEFCDEVWYVFSAMDVRRERLKKGRQYDEQKIEQIFTNQISDENYRKFSTHIIVNESSKAKILEQIEVLLEKKADL